jgi:hypothetical protein
VGRNEAQFLTVLWKNLNFSGLSLKVVKRRAIGLLLVGVVGGVGDRGGVAGGDDGGDRGCGGDDRGGDGGGDGGDERNHDDCDNNAEYLTVSWSII